MFDCSFASIRVAVNSSLGIICPFCAIPDFAASRCCETGLVSTNSTTYIAAHKPTLIASENQYNLKWLLACVWTDLGTTVFLPCCNIYNQFFHLLSTSRETGSSHINFMLHTSLKINFPVIIIDATQPSTSYSELMVDIIFLLVRISYSLMQGVKSNSRVPVNLFHDIPSIMCYNWRWLNLI